MTDQDRQFNMHEPFERSVNYLQEIDSYLPADEYALHGYMQTDKGRHRLLYGYESRVIPDTETDIYSTVWLLGSDKVEVCTRPDIIFYESKLDELKEEITDTSVVGIIGHALDKVYKDMPYSIDGVEGIKSKSNPDSFIRLRRFIQEGSGVCLHQTMYFATLLRMLEKAEILPPMKLRFKFLHGELFRNASDTGPNIHHLALDVNLEDQNICYELDPSAIELKLRENQKLDLDSIKEEINDSIVVID